MAKASYEQHRDVTLCDSLKFKGFSFERARSLCCRNNALAIFLKTKSTFVSSFALVSVYSNIPQYSQCFAASSIDTVRLDSRSHLVPLKHC